MNGDDERSLESFFDEHLDGMSRLAMVLTLDVHQAEDLVQQAALKVQQKWRLVGSADDRGAYARRLMVNEFLAGRRRARGVVLVELTTNPSASDDVAGEVERRHIVTQLMGLLPERQRVAIALRYLEDRPDREIAAILGCRETTVRSLVKRGLDSLRSSTAGGVEEVRDR